MYQCQKNKVYFLLLIIYQIVFAQAGNSVYSFLDLPVSSRLAALGGSNVSLRDNDLNFAFRNPAMLTDETHNTLGLNMANYLSDIQFGSVMYGHNFGKNIILPLECNMSTTAALMVEMN